MKKIILSCLLLGISLTTYAQTSLFDLWQEASEHVNIYTYGIKKINKDTIYRPDNYRPNWKRKKGAKLEISSPTIGLLKKMLEEVESEGFQFNPQNDTLLFNVGFCGWWTPVSYTHLDVYKRQADPLLQLDAQSQIERTLGEHRLGRRHGRGAGGNRPVSGAV